MSTTANHNIDRFAQFWDNSVLKLHFAVIRNAIVGTTHINHVKLRI